LSARSFVKSAPLVLDAKIDVVFLVVVVARPSRARFGSGDTEERVVVVVVVVRRSTTIDGFATRRARR
jgi:hypothetical protein